jgi:hypothetical protein
MMHSQQNIKIEFRERPIPVALCQKYVREYSKIEAVPWVLGGRQQGSITDVHGYSQLHCSINGPDGDTTQFLGHPVWSHDDSELVRV